MKTGVAHSPLHGGYCPPWLFTKMKNLGATIVQAMTMEYGTPEVLRRLSDPVWFQSFGSVLGFDWHSSGLTTVVCGALKEGLSETQGELGLFFAGGKGKASNRTPIEIAEVGEKYGLPNNLVHLQQTSRTVAKVDSAAVQDGYQLYHHFLVFDATGNWAVIQQGMNDHAGYARRYHWLSEDVKDLTENPHKAVCGIQGQGVLNLVSEHNRSSRTASVEILQEKPDKLKKVYNAITDQRTKRKRERSQQLSLFDDNENVEDHSIPAHPIITMPENHPIPSSRQLDKMLYKMYEQPPEDYRQLLETKGAGPSTLRALAMVAEVMHGTQPSFQDPVRYAFAHGGKDGYPFPVERDNISHSLSVLRKAIEKGKMGEMDKLKSLRRLAKQEDRLGSGVN